MTADARANGLMHRQTRLVTGDAASAAQGLRAGRAGFATPGVVVLPEPQLGFTKGFMVRDPDDHAMQVIEK